MARTSQLEEQLTAATRRFVSEVVTLIRQASFSDVAGLGSGSVAGSDSGARTASSPRASASASSLHIGRGRRAGGSAAKSPSTTPKRAATSAASAKDPARQRQTAEKRAELGDRIVAALRAATAPLGVRALASELHVATDLLNAPLIELRAAGKIAKHGEKRATTYAMP